MVESFYSLPGPARLRIALVSDLHERPFERVLASVRARKPDLICIPGDFIHGSPRPVGKALCDTTVPAFFRACAALAPTFVSLGNHEWTFSEEDLAPIPETGAVLLDNGWVRHGPLLIGGQSSAFVTAYRRHREEAQRSGGQDTIYRIARGAKPELGWLEDYCAQEGWRLLLCHHPEYWPRYLRALPIPLTLSGHAHGGQIRLFDQGLYAPGQGFFPKYTGGVYEERLLVSRGLSNNALIPRLFNPRELVYLDLEEVSP